MIIHNMALADAIYCLSQDFPNLFTKNFASSDRLCALTALPAGGTNMNLAWHA